MRFVAHPLRSFSLCLTLLVGAGLATLCAQEQEKTVQDKLFGKPDMSLEFVPRSFSGEKVLKEFKMPDMRIRPFLFRERFAAKEFHAKTFKAKDFHAEEFLGQKEFETKDGLANWRNSAAPTKEAAGLKNFETSAVHDADKTNGADKVFETRKNIVVPGKSQKDLDAEYHEKPALTIDQVRELLNKNK